MASAPDSTATPRRPQSPADALGGLNAKTMRRQQLILGTALALVLAGAGYWIFGPSGDGHPAAGGTDRAQIQVSTDDMVNKTMDQKAWMAMSGNRLNGQDERIKQLEGQGQNLEQLQAQVAQLQQQNQEIKADGQRVIDAYDQENQRLKSGSGAAAGGSAGAPSGADPFPPVGGQVPVYGQAGGYDAQGLQAGADGQPQPFSPAEVKVINFGASAKDDAAGGSSGGGLRTARPDADPVVVEDSPDYLPPNSYAPAKVIVGVDASAGVSSQTDPLPVVLRITGPARSVVQNGRVLTTKIEGCVINGAARGDLSSEKVYVKLAKMTCDQPGGRVAVSDVKGFISFGGKTGVRGRVVSREGALVGQALVAGIAAGFGRGFSANTDATLNGLQVSTGGKVPQLGAAEIVKGGLGNGVASAGDEVSKYLIERAEQYQPVIEMPTGIDVEIVFLDGAYVRSSR
jgi:conjugal transfer pilus assembly protein TraB